MNTAPDLYHSEIRGSVGKNISIISLQNIYIQQRERSIRVINTPKYKYEWTYKLLLQNKRHIHTQLDSYRYIYVSLYLLYLSIYLHLHIYYHKMATVFLQNRMQLQCNVCMEIYNTKERRPLVFPHCGHTFSQDCLSMSHRRDFHIVHLGVTKISG